jgi:hypothetical protein
MHTPLILVYPEAQLAQALFSSKYPVLHTVQTVAESHVLQLDPQETHKLFEFLKKVSAQASHFPDEETL